MKTLSHDEAQLLRHELAMTDVSDEDHPGASDDNQELYDALLERGCIAKRHVVYLLPNPDDDAWMDQWSYDRPYVTTTGRLALLAYIATRM